MPEFIRKLRTEARIFLFSRMLASLVAGLLIWPSMVYALDLFDYLFPIQEIEAGAWLLFLTAMAVACFLLLLLYFLVRRPKTAEIAEEVERSNPLLLDTLNCAVELEKKSKVRDLDFMERRVIQATGQKIAQIAWGKGIRPGPGFWSALAVGFLGGVSLTGFSFSTSPVQKAMAAGSDEPGLTVFTMPSGSEAHERFSATAEFERGTDVSVFAEVTRGHRGEKTARIQFKEKDGAESGISMLATSVLGKFEFVAPSLLEPFVYRVLTPSLSSPWHTLNPYDPPKIKEVIWKITPPSYLGQEVFLYRGFGYLKAPEDSLVELSLEMEDLPKRIGVTLSAKDGNHSLSKQGDDRFQHLFKLSGEWSGRLRLTDLDNAERKPVVSDKIILSPIPDEPPIVEITEPAKDLQLPADAQFLVEVYASDDHGVADVCINVSHAGEKREETIFVEPVEQEKTLTYVFDLNDHALAVGDVITYMALAMDNKEPEGQLARSEVYFIEVLPPEGNATDDQAGEGESAEVKEIPIRDFINKTKKIIRSSYDALLEKDEVSKERQSLAISSDSLSLKHEMTKVYDENEGRFPVVDGIDLGELLNEATYHIEQSEIYAGDLMIEESLEPSEKTLRKLVLLYALLQKMEKKRMKGKGKTASEPDQKQEKEEEDEEEESLAEQLNQMAEDLKKIKELEERQRELNEEIGRAAGQGAQGEPNQRSAQNQEEIRRDVNRLQDDLYQRSGKLGDVAKLKQAGDEMKEAAGDLRRDNPREAQPHGELAEQALSGAVSELESQMAALAGSMVDQLAQEASGLSQSQRDLLDETQEANPGDGEPLKERQDQLNQEAMELLEKIGEMARALGRFNENAMEDLLKSARDSREDGLERSGKRASNSLLYENFPSAEREEGKVAENLENLEGDLGEVADKLRNLGNQALQELVEDLMRMEEDLAGMGAKEMRESAEEIARALGSLPNSSKDDTLQNLTRFFEQVAISDDPTRSKSMASAAIAEAIQLTEQFFWKELKENLLRRNQASTSAPSRYKRQVEEYFRRIAEGE